MPHWTIVHTYERTDTRETATAAELYARYGRFLRLARFSLINVTIGDLFRADDGITWKRTV